MLRSDGLRPSPRPAGAFFPGVADTFSVFIGFPEIVREYLLAVMIRFLFVDISLTDSCREFW
jgi:hypothetical protein